MRAAHCNDLSASTPKEDASVRPKSDRTRWRRAERRLEPEIFNMRRLRSKARRNLVNACSSHVNCKYNTVPSLPVSHTNEL